MHIASPGAAIYYVAEHVFKVLGAVYVYLAGIATQLLPVE